MCSVVTKCSNGLYSVLCARMDYTREAQRIQGHRIMCVCVVKP